MRLAEFILANIEHILAEWESFARSIGVGGNMDQAALRDHAEDILRATVRDMNSEQTAGEQSEKSMGRGEVSGHSDQLNDASSLHAVGRVHSGFNLLQLVSEYRALRASVIRLWTESHPSPHLDDLLDLTRFNESMDQSITKSVGSFTQQLDRARQMFLAILGHDLRDPLNTIVMTAGVLQQKFPQPENVEWTKQIIESANVISRMTTDLLTFALNASGAGIPITPSRFNLSELAREVMDEFRAGHPGRALGFTCDGDMQGEWDRARLRQVIANLLGNAIQHGTGAVRLTCWEKGDMAGFSILNSGPPIPPELLPTIFDPMVRGADKRYTPDRSGSMGLGLHIAKQIVLAHGGTIDVTSSAELGTTFTVKLPRRRVS